MLERIRHANPWELFVAVATFASLVVGAITLPEPYKTWTLFLIAGLVVAALFLTFLQVAAKPKPKPLKVVQPGANMAQLEEAVALGKRVYEKNKIASEYPEDAVVMEWWHRYPEAAFLVFGRESDELFGYVSIWPLTESAFHSLSSGEKRERDLVGGDIRRKGDGTFRYWYIADVCREPNVPRNCAGYVVGFLLAQALIALAGSGDISEKVDLLAIGVSTAGKNLLRRNGFTQVKKDSKIYCRSTSRQEILMAARELMSDLAPMEASVKEWLHSRQKIKID